MPGTDRSWTRGRPVDDHPGDERPRRTEPAGREGRRSISRLAERIRCPFGSCLAQIGVGPAAGRWTITQVTNGPEGPSLPAAKVGDQFLVLPNGYAVPWDHAWHRSELDPRPAGGRSPR